MKFALAPVPEPVKDGLTLAGRVFRSRLLVGTGKYKNVETAADCIRASGAEIITVAVRRIDLKKLHQQSLQDLLSPEKYTYMPNSSGCYTAEEACRLLLLAREISGWNLIKLEVIGDKKTLEPNMPETIRATKLLAKEGFDVMAYTSDKASEVQEVEDAGAIAVMPLAAPIGSGLGIINPKNIEKIIRQAGVPVIVDAGIGTASDASIAMELGCDGVLMNTAIAKAKDPHKMAIAMKLAVESGRLAYYAGRMEKKQQADPSSPQRGVIE